MPVFQVSVVIPTLSADSRLAECLHSLSRQTFQDFEIIVVDNSCQGLARRHAMAFGGRLIENSTNQGFGAAINRGVQCSNAPFLATLNDDAVAHPEWLEALVAAIERRPDVGMCASQVRFYGERRLDSAGMLISGDGSGKQRGHGRAPEDFPVLEEALMPSGSAALYRRAMLDAIGGFDSRFFLYCEDIDLGLRARWAGWKCLYVPGAVVEHHYSHSAGRASPTKAYYVERNRLFTIIKNFPAELLIRAPLITVARYFWHVWYLLVGRGAAAHFRADGHAVWKMPWYTIRAHLALAAHAPELWRERRDIRARARITPAVFRHLLHSYRIPSRKVAML